MTDINVTVNNSITKTVSIGNSVGTDSLSARLVQTGSYLESLVSVSSAGVNTINTKSGVLLLTGSGNITVSSNGQTLIISGDTGNFYPNNNPSGFVTGLTISTGNFITTGQTGQFVPTGLTGRFIGINNRTLYDASNSPSVEWDTRVINNSLGYQVIDWENLLLNDSSNINSLSWETRGLINTGGLVTLYWGNKTLMRSGQGGPEAVVLDWGSLSLTGGVWNAASGFTVSGRTVTTGLVLRPSDTGILTGIFYPLSINPSGYLTGLSTGNFITNLQTGQFVPTGATGRFIGINNYNLYDNSNNQSIDWGTRYLLDTLASTSVDWSSRELSDSVGAINLNWNTRNLTGGSWNAGNGFTVSGQTIVTGSVTRPSDTGNFVDRGQTGNFVSVISKSMHLENPTTGDKIVLFWTNNPLTLRRAKSVVYTSGSSPSVTYSLSQSAIRTGVTGVIMGSTIETNQNTGTLYTTFNNSTITGGNYVFFECSGATNINNISLTLEF